MQQTIYPKKVFGELTLKGGLHNITQTIKAKYLLPTKDYPTGKAVIEINVPESINAVQLDKNSLKELPEINKRLAQITFYLDADEAKGTLSKQIEFNKMVLELAENGKKQPYVTRSFRFEEKDFVETHIVMNYFAKLFGYLFYKNKTEIEKIGSPEHLAGARNAVAGTMSKNVYENFIKGFDEGLSENG